MSKEAQHIEAYVRSGIIKDYVLGLASKEDCIKLEQLIEHHLEIAKAIDDFSIQVEIAALANAIDPPVTIKPLLMATVDYMDRLENGEPFSFPPLLNENSTIEEYLPWLNRPDMKVDEHFKDIHVKIVGHTPECTTAIVWIKHMAPQEVHEDEYERFLIVEGTCTISISATDHHLSAGDYLSIPLHQNHLVKVTSSIPCKVILQRVAA